LGKLYGNLGKFDEAINIWEEGLKLVPNDLRFKENIMKAQKLKQN